MKQLLNLAFFAFVGILLVSCGPSQKMRAATAKIDSLTVENNALNSQVADNDKQIAQLKTENAQFSKEAQECKDAKEAIAANMEAMKKENAEKEAAIDELLVQAQASKQKLVEAGAEVEFEDGLVHISMPEKFKFKNGSYGLSSKGKEGLKAIADVLNEYPDAKAIIVGNADTSSIKGDYDNWSLSTERANAVIRILTTKHKIDPARLTSAGWGKYHPIASNKTKAGRAENRRFEVILQPSLARLWEILEK